MIVRLYFYRGTLFDQIWVTCQIQRHFIISCLEESIMLEVAIINTKWIE